MDPAAISYRIVEDGHDWHWEVRLHGRPVASGTEGSAVGARVRALLHGSGVTIGRASEGGEKAAH